MALPKTSTIKTIEMTTTTTASIMGEKKNLRVSLMLLYFSPKRMELSRHRHRRICCLRRHFVVSGETKVVTVVVVIVSILVVVSGDINASFLLVHVSTIVSSTAASINNAKRPLVNALQLPLQRPQDYRQKIDILKRSWKNNKEQRNQQKGSLKHMKKTAPEDKALLKTKCS
ncbi:transmembrane protein, putative [Medicago truncatula]|uniref:Transmembrane protein, putative n=1 Tax=Medicago truncatula TaxID=3880 RepID=A0A072UYS1_MEDTR|nr:transmembrane protein, putative [Medicago truncatula]